MNHIPPKWADRFLEWYCDPYLLEDLQGDLHEIFHNYCDQGNSKRARYIYIWLVLRSFRFSALKRNQKLKNSIFMITKNNLKVAVRVLWRDKFNSSVNLLGLVLGIACFLLLGLFVKQELSFDKFHTKKNRIYRSWLKEDYGDNRVFFNSSTPLRFEALFENNFPEVERSVQYFENNFLVGNEENRIDETVSTISPDFFEVFDFNLIHGEVTSPLRSKHSLVISESYATKYFGARDPIGATLAIQLDSIPQEFTVTAIFEDMPKASSIRFEMAISTDNNRRLFSEEAMTAWFDVYGATYVLTHEGAEINKIEDKMQDVIMTHLGQKAQGDNALERGQYQIGFQPLTDIHLNPDIPLGYAPVANPQYIMILGFIGILVLVMACLNYTTLSVGQSLRRTREVGIRKVLGARRGTLTYQYLFESIILSIVAMGLSIALMIFLIPTFNALTGTELYYEFQWSHLFIFALIAIVIGVMSGFYPALMISSSRVSDILKGIQLNVGKQNARKGLLIIQFIVTVFLISSVLIMRQQINYLMNKDLGYDYEAVVSAQLPIDPTSQGLLNAITSAMHNGELLKTRLESHPEISKIAMGTHLFGSNGWANLAFTDLNGDFKRFRLLAVNSEYLPAFNIELKEGRGFEKGNGLDERQSVILNETAVQYFGLEEPIGGKIPGKYFGEHQIIGVMKDFHYSSLHSKIEPLVIVQNIIPIFEGVSDVNSSESPIPKIVFTYSGNNLHDAIELLDNEWTALFPDESVNYQFIDDRIRAQYENEARLNKLIMVATVLSLIIASLGLFGLIMVITNDKVKEIGIRKVMGANTLSLFHLLSKSFVLQMLIAIVLSVPLTIIMMQNWLDNFAYHIELNPIPFLFASVITIAVAAFVTMYHTFRATHVNPIESLRAE